MTPSVTVYGFGSAFAKVASAEDIDLLIVHACTDAASCELAIQCKYRLAERIASAHVTMLSSSEELHFQFIKRARAFGLGTVRRKCLEKDLECLFEEIYRHLI